MQGWLASDPFQIMYVVWADPGLASPAGRRRISTQLWALEWLRIGMFVSG